MGGSVRYRLGQKLNPFLLVKKEKKKLSENKRYYWLKLQENFFDDDTIDFIESQENGEKYVLFYLKLCLKALKNEGKLIRYVGEMLLPFDDVGLSKITRTDIDTVRSALILFSKIGLIKKLDTGEIFLTQLNEMVGTETQKAKYMRERRLQERNNGVTMLPECNSDVTQSIELRDVELEERVKDKKAETKAKKPCGEHQKVYDHYLKNYDTLYQQGKLFTNKVEIEYGKCGALLKRLLPKYSLDELFTVIDRAMNDTFILGGGYNLSVILSANQLNKLLNAKPQQNQQFKNFDKQAVVEKDFFSQQ